MHLLRSSNVPPGHIREIEIKNLVGELLGVKVLSEVLFADQLISSVTLSDLNAEVWIYQDNVFCGDLWVEAGICLEVMPEERLKKICLESQSLIIDWLSILTIDDGEVLFNELEREKFLEESVVEHFCINRTRKLAESGLACCQ